MRKKNSWLVVILVQKDKDSEWEYRELLKTIRAVRHDSRLKFLLLEFNQDYNTAVVKTSNPRPGKFTNEVSKVRNSFRENFKITDPENLGWFFSYYVKEHASHSERSMLITWGHGVGLGFFSHSQEQPHTINKFFGFLADRPADEPGVMSAELATAFLYANSIIAAGRVDVTDKMGIKTLSFMETTSVPTVIALSAKQLSSIITDKMGKDFKFDVFIANNCYMQMAEVCADLSASVRLYIASQNSVPFAGVNYDRLFKRLHSFSELREVAGCVMDYFVPKYSDTEFAARYKEKRPEFKYEAVTLSAVSLEIFSEVIEIINEVAAMILEEIQIAEDFQRRVLKLARSYCISEPRNLGSIDFEKFLVELIKAHELVPIFCKPEPQSTPEELSMIENKLGSFRAMVTRYVSLLKTLNDVKGKVVLAKLHAPILFMTDANIMASICSSGFSVYFPSDTDKSDTLITGELMDSFYFMKNPAPDANPLTSGNWGSFLKKFLKITES